MHKDRNQNKWAEFKTKAKNHWGNLNDKPLNCLNIERNRADEDIYNAQKIKTDRADKHLRNVNHLLEAMALDNQKNKNEH